MSTTMNASRVVLEQCICCLSKSDSYSKLTSLDKPLSKYFRVAKQLSISKSDDEESLVVCKSCCGNARRHIEEDVEKGIIKDPEDPIPTCQECERESKYCGSATCRNIDCTCDETNRSCDLCQYSVCEDCNGEYFDTKDGSICDRCYMKGDYKSNEEDSEEDEDYEEKEEEEEEESIVESDSESQDNSIKKRKRSEGDISGGSPAKKHKP